MSLGSLFTIIALAISAFVLMALPEWAERPGKRRTEK